MGGGAGDYLGRRRRTRGEKLISRHLGQGQRKTRSFGNTMWPQFLQMRRPLVRVVMGKNLASTTQYGQRSSLFAISVARCSLAPFHPRECPVSNA